MCVIASGCGSRDEEVDPPPASATAAAPGAAEAPNAPSGPVFRSTVMGMERVEPLVALDLTPGGLPGMTIQAPESATAAEARPSGTRASAPGLNYSLSIRPGAFILSAAKAGREVMDAEGTALEEDDRHLLWQGSGSRGFSFSMQVDVDGEPYTCGTVATAFAFTRDQVDQMIESCGTLAKSE